MPAPTVVTDRQPQIGAEPTYERTGAADEASVTWTASEFVTHAKTAGWYGLLGLAAVLIAAIAWLLTRDFFPTIMVAVSILMLGIYAARKPRQQSYELDSRGLTIGGRYYSFHEFRSFAVVPDGAFLSIELTPLKRFATYTTIYFDPKDEDKIIGFLAGKLPMEEPHANLADNLMRRIHF